MIKLPSWAPIAGYILLAAGLFGAGWTTRGWRDGSQTASAVIKRDAQVDKIEAGDRADVKEQDNGDREKIAKLEADLASLASRPPVVVRVPVNPSCPVPSTEADAGAREAERAYRESIGRLEKALADLEAGDTAAAALAEKLRLQVLSCQGQWPK